MWPSLCAASSGRKARIPWMTPHRLTPSTHFHAESGPNHGSAWLPTPALLQTTCTAPKRSTAAAARALTATSSLTSVGTASVLAPRPAILSEAACSAGCSTSASTTSSPARANRSASASPIPLAAPVTTATFPAVSSMVPPLVRPGFTLHRLVRPRTPGIFVMQEHRCWADRRDPGAAFPTLWPGRACQVRVRPGRVNGVGWTGEPPGNCDLRLPGEAWPRAPVRFA